MERLVSAGQEERNRRAFQGWLIRKQEERKQEVAAGKSAVNTIEAERMEEEKRLMATRAYQQWLRNKKMEQQEKSKERMMEHEQQILHKEQRRLQQEKAQDDFLLWKRRKDLERGLKEGESMRETQRKETVRVEQTPSLPGYCSVWSCDEELADQMLTKVHRESNY